MATYSENMGTFQTRQDMVGGEEGTPGGSPKHVQEVWYPVNHSGMAVLRGTHWFQGVCRSVSEEDSWCLGGWCWETGIHCRKTPSYAAYCHGLWHRWKFISRTNPIAGVLFTPLETAIHNHLLPSILGKQDISESMRKILALPTWCGGLGLTNPQEDVTRDYTASCLLSRLLSELILQQEGCIPPNCYAKQTQAKITISQQQ